MRELADETEIRPTGGGTAVRLVVYRSASAAPGPPVGDDAPAPPEGTVG